MSEIVWLLAFGLQIKFTEKEYKTSILTPWKTEINEWR